VFDDATLDIVMSEMDTITDFTNYLSKKENVIRSGHLAGALGEEDLIAYYATHADNSGEHDFTRPDGSPLADNEMLMIAEGHYSSWLTNPQYLAKKHADEDSYVWDRLIETFTNNLLAGTNIVPDGLPSELAEVEEGVRHMVLVPRYMRRLFGRGILEVLRLGMSTDRMTRAFLPGPTEAKRETGFFFMTLAVPQFELKGGYEQYRRGRFEFLRIYALTFLRKYPNLKRIVGIATEPLPSPGSRGGSSEDLILVDSPNWSDELIKSLEEDQRLFGVVQEGRYEEYQIRGSEYPEVH